MSNPTVTREGLNREFLPHIIPLSAFSGFLSITGFVGNVIVFYVYLLKYPVCNFRYFVLYLSAIDIVCCTVHWFVYHTPQICTAKSFFQNATVTATSYGLFLIAVDRFLKVRSPLGRQITPSCARILTIVFFIVACIVASPMIYLSGEHNSVKTVDGTSVNVTQCEEKSQYKNSTWIGIYTKYCYVTPNSVCMGLTIVLYIFIGTALMQRKKAASSVCCESNNEVGRNRAIYNIHQHFLLLNRNHNEAELAETSFSNTNGTTETVERSSAVTCAPKATSSKTAVRKTCASRDEKSLYMKRTMWKTKLLRQTLITFLVTILFVATVVIYQVYLLKLRLTYTYLQELDYHGAITFLVSNSMFFINCVINPFLYGFLDRRFQKIIKESGLRLSGSIRRLRQRVVRK
ncbi:hypothetical protein ACJMK2_038034 [Sinanodonta woodiana]|uniref:G-protein coupled receptors family 1 profile domain-containing protein n=1 Tax=Sinanodonta woodiana TaxID=1069815 RepID=A0ABD3WNN8_SINWO